MVFSGICSSIFPGMYASAYMHAYMCTEGGIWHMYVRVCVFLQLQFQFHPFATTPLPFHVPFLHLFPLRFYCDAQKIFASHRTLVVIHQEYINSNTIVIIPVIKKNEGNSNKTTKATTTTTFRHHQSAVCTYFFRIYYWLSSIVDMLNIYNHL